MGWLAYLAMAAGLLPVVCMAFGYFWVRLRDRRRRLREKAEGSAVDPSSAPRR